MVTNKNTSAPNALREQQVMKSLSTGRCLHSASPPVLNLSWVLRHDDHSLYKKFYDEQRQRIIEGNTYVVVVLRNLMRQLQLQIANHRNYDGPQLQVRKLE